MIEVLNRGLTQAMKYLVLLVFIPSLSKAQNTDGSVYSIFGIGSMKQQATVQSRAMGFASIGLSNAYFVNSVNPAANDLAGKYFNHMVDIGGYYSTTTHESMDLVEQSASGGLSNFNFWFRFNDRWSANVGYNPLSEVAYNIHSEETFVFNDVYDVRYLGDGGLNEAYFSNGFSITDNLSVGLKLAFIFGNIEHNERIYDGLYTQELLVENATNFSKLYAEYSLNYRFNREKYNINAGLIYKNETRLVGVSTSSLTESDYLSGTSELLFDEVEGSETYVLPRRVGLGLSFNTQKLILAADLEYNQWSQAQIEDYDSDLRDTWRYSLGLEVTPDRQDRSLVKRMSYRAGAYMENSYLTIENMNFSEYGITTGVSVPLRKGSAVNVAYLRKLNGTRSNQLVYESTNEISLNLTIRQRWFEQPKYH